MPFGCKLIEEVSPGTFKVNEDGLAALTRSKRPLVVIGSCGTVRVGKTSFTKAMCKALSGCDPEFLKARMSLRSVTNGIDAVLIPHEEVRTEYRSLLKDRASLANEPVVDVVLLDCEGWGLRDPAELARLTMVCFVVSSCVNYHVPVTLTNEDFAKVAASLARAHDLVGSSRGEMKTMLRSTTLCFLLKNTCPEQLLASGEQPMNVVTKFPERQRIVQGLVDRVEACFVPQPQLDPATGLVSVHNNAGYDRAVDDALRKQLAVAKQVPATLLATMLRSVMSTTSAQPAANGLESALVQYQRGELLPRVVQAQQAALRASASRGLPGGSFTLAGAQAAVCSAVRTAQEVAVAELARCGVANQAVLQECRNQLQATAASLQQRVETEYRTRKANYEAERERTKRSSPRYENRRHRQTSIENYTEQVRTGRFYSCCNAPQGCQGCHKSLIMYGDKNVPGLLKFFLTPVMGPVALLSDYRYEHPGSLQDRFTTVPRQRQVEKWVDRRELVGYDSHYTQGAWSDSMFTPRFHELVR